MRSQTRCSAPAGPLEPYVYITSRLYTRVGQKLPATFGYKNVLVASRHLFFLRGLEQGLFPLISSLSLQHFTIEGMGCAFHIVHLVSSGVQSVAP